MDEGVRRAKEGNFAFIGESVSLDLAVARHCELVRAHEVVGMRGYSIAAALGEDTHLILKIVQPWHFTKKKLNDIINIKPINFLKAPP